MKGLISAQKVYALLREAGQEKLIDKIRGAGSEIKLSRKDVKRIGKMLTNGETVCVVRKQSNPTDYEFVSPKFVTIRARRHFEKKSFEASTKKLVDAPNK